MWRRGQSHSGRDPRTLYVRFHFKIKCFNLNTDECKRKSSQVTEPLVKSPTEHHWCCCGEIKKHQVLTSLRTFQDHQHYICGHRNPMTPEPRPQTEESTNPTMCSSYRGTSDQTGWYGGRCCTDSSNTALTLYTV